MPLSARFSLRCETFGVRLGRANGGEMAIGDFFQHDHGKKHRGKSKRHVADSQIFSFQQPPKGLKHVNDASLKPEMFAFHVQFSMSAGRLRDVTVSTDFGVVNPKKNVTVPGID